ncbi:MAG: recombination protein RecR [Gemmatimonadetes bacterium]|uniref:Recombination protein RecR n=1 Tax=Candidatus Kutchimonas denitrificans TaxID=3056748 RepID=A0AAE5CBY1_9BACT|nr:recombination protein RecR [Gemmatimonadota bacterium]NIR74985.1 recombination protein RecR [Candidatus Kutchimonas denitrificans]NIS01568.1 recombination protein RecR [Gemmatimonadota bacterium]NIT67306.1 recombination protein RecR [Gemmatimonadota bacterium]NIU52669.1 recombination protein RecR [Gemmatimonadota bacterium]
MSVIDDLASEFTRLPGIGRKTAYRLTHYLLKIPPEEACRLARAIEAMAERVRRCSICNNLSESDPCEFCTNPTRDRTVICVVEEASDIAAIDGSGGYRGLYHVLGGCLSPLDGIGPEELNVDSLLARLNGEVREVIIATNPSVEGEATATYLHRAIGSRGVQVTRLARGLPVGGDLEYADGVTIAQALSGRRGM